MNLVWTWGGLFFGYLEGENLWTCEGKHIGKLRHEVVYGPDGRYLGELKQGSRLLRQIGPQPQCIPAFTPYATRPPGTRYPCITGSPLPADHEDFPAPESFS